MTDELKEAFDYALDAHIFMSKRQPMIRSMDLSNQVAMPEEPQDQPAPMGMSMPSEADAPEPSKPLYTEDQLALMPEWISGSKKMFSVMNDGQRFIGSDKQAAAYGLDLMSEFNWNMTGPAGIPGESGISAPGFAFQVAALMSEEAGEENALTFLQMLNTYSDTATNGATIKRAFRGIFADPLTYAGIVGKLGSMGIRASAGFAKGPIKDMLMKTATGAAMPYDLGVKYPGRTGMAAGAGYGMGFEGGTMGVEQAAGYGPTVGEAATRLATAGAVGAGAGGVLGKALGAGVPAAGQALRQGADVAGQAAEARMAERGPITDRVMSGGDPMDVVDPALAAADKLARGDDQMNAPTSQIAQPGKEIPPSTIPPTADEISAAQADTRQGADIVAQRLNVTVPETERVQGGVYKSGQPSGQKWSDLPDEKLAERGPGFVGNDADLDTLWQQTLDEVSPAARDAVERTGATWKAFPAGAWNKAMSLPNRSQLWYELSGESFVDRLPDLTAKEHMMFLDLVGATSARAKPKENLERSLAVLSQKIRGVPIDVDLTIQSTVADALQREGTNISSDLANKTGMFSDTLGLVAGLPVRYPISVNDVWVGKAFGITDAQLSGNQALHEVFGKYMNKMREFINSQTNEISSGQSIPHESWQLQARQWVEMRASDEGIDTSKQISVEGNDYAGEFDRVIEKIEAAGIDVPGGIITKDILMNPALADALRPTTPSYRSAPKATVEFGTLLTPSGKQAAELYAKAKEAGDQLTQKEYIKTLTSGMYQSARGKTLWEETVRLATGTSQTVTRISSPTSNDPFAFSGTFEGAAAPNIRIPLKDMTPDQVAYFNAMAGQGLRQKAMAAAEIKTLNSLADPVPEGYVSTNSIYFEWNQTVPEDLVVGIANALGEGFEVSIAKTPGGVKVDINPKFMDDGTISGPSAGAIDAATDLLEKSFGVKNVEVFKSAFKSDYGKNYVEDPGDGSEYLKILEQTVKGWENEAATKIKSIAGKSAKQSDIIAFIRGDADELATTGTRTETASIRGKAKTIRKNVRARIDRHNAAIDSWREIGDDLDAKMSASIPKWKKRLKIEDEE